MHSTFCETLEGRTLCVRSPYLDPAYSVSATGLAKLAGEDTAVYQAVPAAGGRTYLLAERFDPKLAPLSGPVGLLTIAAVTADGQLDPTFGTGGVALTGRFTQKHFTSLTSPGLLKVDTAGRLYYADDVRVLRFRANGTADTTFGTHGAVTYSDDSQPVALCDIAPVDNGVLVATTKTVKGVESYSVIRIDRRVHKAFLATHDTGAAGGDNNGTGGVADPNDPQVYDTYQYLEGNKAQFAQSAGGLLLVRVQSDNEKYYARGDAGDATLAAGPVRQDAVVTRLDTAGRGVDIARHQLRQPAEHTSADLGESNNALPHEAAVLSPNGRVLLVQTEQEVQRFNLKTGTVKRYSLPGGYGFFKNPRYHVLPDGNVWVFDQRYKQSGENYIHTYAIYKYLLDGTLDKTFADNGVLVVGKSDYPAGDDEYVKQVFLDSAGRLNFRAQGQIYHDGQTPDRSNTLTLRRV